MSGIPMRVSKLFGGKNNLVISALDHVLEYGDQPGIEDAAAAIERCLTTDALLLSAQMLRRHADLMSRPGAPVPVIRINWSSAFYYPLKYHQGYTTVATTVEEAVRVGGEAVICSLFLENQDEEMETANVGVFSEVVRMKERLGIPLIGECYVVEHEEIGPKATHAKVKRVTRVMAELGADLIKCFYTGERFAEVVANTPVPVFTIGAEKLDTDLEVLQKAHDSVAGGARGIIFGRNIFMARDPVSLVAALKAVVNEGIEPRAAVDRYGLE